MASFEVKSSDVQRRVRGNDLTLVSKRVVEQSQEGLDWSVGLSEFLTVEEDVTRACALVLCRQSGQFGDAFDYLLQAS